MVSLEGCIQNVCYFLGHCRIVFTRCLDDSHEIVGLFICE